MKKLLLTLGSIAAVAAPVASVVACGAPAQKHVKLDVDKIEALVPDLTTAVEEAMNKTDGLKGASHTVVADGDKFKVTFTDGGMNIELEVTSDGAVTSFKMPGKGSTLIDATPDQLKGVQKVMEGGTIDHSGDSIDTSDFDVTTLDATIVQELKDASFEAPVLAAGADHQTISDYNDATDAYMHKYNAQIADDALAIMNGNMQLKISEADYSAIKIPGYQSLNADLMKTIGLPDDAVAKLTKLIGLGADVQVTFETGQADLSGTVSNTSNDGSINWSHGAADSQITFKA